LGGLAVLWNFDKRQTTKCRPEELRSEFTHLTLLKWQTIAICGNDFEVQEVKEKIWELGWVSKGGTKRRSSVGTEWDASKRWRMVGGS